MTDCDTLGIALNGRVRLACVPQRSPSMICSETESKSLDYH